MSMWYEVFGWVMIAFGGCATFWLGRPILVRSAGLDSRQIRRARKRRRKAWLDLRYSLNLIVIGVGQLTSWRESWLFSSLECAYLIVMVSWDVRAGRMPRRRRRSGGQAPQAS
jgi:hypothetical protein